MNEVLLPAEARRYARHIILRGIGGVGQQALKAARVAVIGAGGLGSPVIAYLAAAGVGVLGVIDDDEVSVSNLQRQIIHTTAAEGRSKVESASDFVAGLNPHVAYEALGVRLDESNAVRLLEGYDLVVDGTDNFRSRRLAAGAARSLGIPLVTGAVSTFDGQVTVFVPDGPQFDDLYPAGPAEEELFSCEQVGVLGTVTGVIGTMMAMEAIKLVTGIGRPLVGRLLLYDGLSAQTSELSYGSYGTAKRLAVHEASSALLWNLPTAA